MRLDVLVQHSLQINSMLSSRFSYCRIRVLVDVVHVNFVNPAVHFVVSLIVIPRAFESSFDDIQRIHRVEVVVVNPSCFTELQLHVV